MTNPQPDAPVPPENPESPAPPEAARAPNSEPQHEGGIALNIPDANRIAPPIVIEPPESHEVGRKDWKTMILAGFAFFAVFIAVSIATSSKPGNESTRATLVPGIASCVCLLYGLWKLMRLESRTAKEERMLGFFAIFLFWPVLLQTFFIPFVLVLALRRPTDRPSAKGKFALGATMGCGVMFFIALLGMGLLMLAFR